MGSTPTSISKPLSAMPLSLSARRRHGRAVNAVAEFFRKSLRVPEIYLGLGAPLKAADVIAVDAAGSGDIHAAEIKVFDARAMSTTQVLEEVRKLRDLPSHFKYLVLPVHPAIIRLQSGQGLFSSDGIGRIGILELIESESEPPTVQLAVKAERFKVAPTEMAKVERLLDRSSPDMFVRV
jgi:hypothetical protein